MVGRSLCFGFNILLQPNYVSDTAMSNHAHHKKEDTKREGTLVTKKFMYIKRAITKLATIERFAATKPFGSSNHSQRVNGHAEYVRLNPSRLVRAKVRDVGASLRKGTLEHKLNREKGLPGCLFLPVIIITRSIPSICLSLQYYTYTP